MSKSKKAQPQPTQKTFAKIFDLFDAPVMKVNCGEKCAHLNEGGPVCCDVDNAIPIMQVAEWKLLKSRSNLWKAFKPYDEHTQGIVDELSDQCKAVECKGAMHCERDNRSLSCRAFPFFPYIGKDGEIMGLSYYWHFEDTCWVISNQHLVEQDFIDQFIEAYEILFKKDPEEYEVFVDYSATQRRVFSRRKQNIPVLGKKGKIYLIKPKKGGIKKGSKKDLPKFKPFK